MLSPSTLPFGMLRVVSKVERLRTVSVSNGYRSMNDSVLRSIPQAERFPDRLVGLLDRSSDLFHPDKPRFLPALCRGLDKVHIETGIFEDFDDFLFASPAGPHSSKPKSNLLDEAE